MTPALFKDAWGGSPFAWGGSPFETTKQSSFTNGRTVLTGLTAKRYEEKRTDYLLRYRRDLTLAVVEAKPYKASAGDGLQQAKGYAEILGLRFAYATNGREIIEFDFLKGIEQKIECNPTPDESWHRYQIVGMPLTSEITVKTMLQLLNKTVSAILSGQKRTLQWVLHKELRHRDKWTPSRHQPTMP